MKSQQLLKIQRHTFSHFHLDYQPVKVELAEGSAANRVTEDEGLVWYNPQNPLSLGMPAPIKALLLGQN